MSSTLERETASVQVEEVSGPSTALTRVEDHNGSIAAFSSQGHFDTAQRMAKALASSSMVPKDYQGNVANCLVAMELASRTRSSVLAVMQNTHVINGRPSWSSIFLIASVNSCGRFSALRYETRGGEDPKDKRYEVRAYATELATGDVLHGEWISWPMVDGEGWSKKQGSKWLTMPGQMFRYRAAAFWTRSYCPEISLGMHTAEEAEDMPPVSRTGGARELNQQIRAADETVPAPTATARVSDDDGHEETEQDRADRDLFAKERGGR